jgi:hypothetical protein
LVTSPSDFTPASLVTPHLSPPQPAPDSSHHHPTIDGMPCAPSPISHVSLSPTISHIIPTAVDMPDASSTAPADPHHRNSPRRFSLPAEEDVLGLKEGVLGLHFTNFPLGLLSSDCANVTSPCAVADLDLFEDAWTDKIRAQLPVPASLQDSLVHIVGRQRVCGIFGDNTRVCAFTPTDVTPPCSLLDSNANLCMTNNPNLLVDVCPCPPFTISLVTTDGGHSHTNVCRCRGLLPLPLLDGTTY